MNHTIATGLTYPLLCLNDHDFGFWWLYHFYRCDKCNDKLYS